MMQKLLRQLFGFVLQLFFQYEGRPQTILFAPRTASMIAASPVKGFGLPVRLTAVFPMLNGLL